MTNAHFGNHLISNIGNVANERKRLCGAPTTLFQQGFGNSAFCALLAYPVFRRQRLMLDRLGIARRRSLGKSL